MLIDLRDRPVATELTELVEAARHGDPQAWEDLVTQFQSLVYGTAARHRLDASSCHDVAQATWLSLVEHIDSIRVPQALPGWLRTTATRESLRLLRLSGRETPTESPGLANGLDNTFEIDSRLDRGRLMEWLSTLLDDLSPRHRVLIEELVLADEPISYRDLSARLNMPIGSIGPTKARALAQLRAPLEACNFTVDVVL